MIWSVFTACDRRATVVETTSSLSLRLLCEKQSKWTARMVISSAPPGLALINQTPLGGSTFQPLFSAKLRRRVTERDQKTRGDYCFLWPSVAAHTSGFCYQPKLCSHGDGGRVI